MPIGLALALAVAGAAAAAIAGQLLVHRSVPLQVRETHNEVAGFIYAVLGVFYGVLLGFVVVAVWERYVEARQIAEQEANALGDLFRDAAAYPTAERARVRRAVRAYAHAVISDEWAAMARGGVSARAVQAYDEIWREYAAIEPRTERERLWHQQSLDHLNDLGDQRRLRLLHGRSAIPTLMWAVLYVLGILTVGFSYFFGLRSTWSHALMTGTLAAALALILGLLRALEQPFAGPAAIPPDALRELIENLRRPGA